MTNELETRVAIEIASFEFFKDCIANGATVDQARAEMVKSIDVIAERVHAILVA